MKQQYKEIILEMCNCSMNASKVAREMNYSKGNILHHLDKIEEKYGLNPRKFYDLVELRRMALEEMKE